MSTYAPHRNVLMCFIFCTFLLVALHMQTSGIDPQDQAQVQAQAQARDQARDQAQAQAQVQAQDQAQAQAQDQVCRLPVLINDNDIQTMPLY